MHFETEHIYPNCPTITRTVSVGGLTKSELIQKLQRNATLINEVGEELFASDHFTTSATRYSVTTLELTVRDLGFARGTTIAEIYARAGVLGLGLCPIELGPYLRLQYLDQPEGYWGKPVWKHQAPYGSITIASEKITEDHDFPKGFYLRRIKGVLWLRGYHSGPEHIWSSDDHFIFVKHKDSISVAQIAKEETVQDADRSLQPNKPLETTRVNVTKIRAACIDLRVSKGELASAIKYRSYALAGLCSIPWEIACGWERKSRTAERIMPILASNQLVPVRIR